MNEIQVNYKLSFEKIDRSFREGSLALCLTSIKEILNINTQLRDKYHIRIGLVEWHEEKVRKLQHNKEPLYGNTTSFEVLEEQAKAINNYKTELGNLIRTLKNDKKLEEILLIEEQIPNTLFKESFKVKEISIRDKRVDLSYICDDFRKVWLKNIQCDTNEWSLKLTEDFDDGRYVEVEIMVDQTINAVTFYYIEETPETEYFLSILMKWWNIQLCKVRVFVSYSHLDSDWKVDLIKQFYSMVKSEMVDIFEDGKIEGGQEWKPILLRRLEKSEIILFLVSPDLLHSKFIEQNEIPLAMNLSQENKSVVFPIFTRWIDIEGTFLGRIQGFPNANYNYKYLSEASDREKALYDVVQEIRIIVNNIYSRKTNMQT
jgi:hypothetical protein